MKKLAIIGAGPAGMMAADVLAARNEVHLYDRHVNHGRKFLVAGEGGFNLTNELDGEALMDRYHPREFMAPFISAFGSKALRGWLDTAGISTYTGSSGRVFPVKGLKPHEVLKSIRKRLERAGVMFHGGYEFIGFDDHARPVLRHDGISAPIDADHYFFALGGASWPVTGSTGTWRKAFDAIGIRTHPFRSSNCGVVIEGGNVLERHAGRPLKNITINCGGTSVRGEAMLTMHGLEGNAIYPLIPRIREEADKHGEAVLRIDLKPDLTTRVLEQRLADSPHPERMAATRLPRQSMALLKHFTDRKTITDPKALAAAIKELCVPVLELRPVNEAISTIGGVAIEAVDEHLVLRSHPHISVMGEMLDWDAPTGGFLLQGSFSTGYRAAAAFNERV